MFDIVIILKFGKTKVGKEECYSGAKKHIKIWDANIDNIAISILVQKKNNSKYLSEYLDEVIRPLFWYYLKWVNMFRNLEIKVEIRIINWCLCI